MDCPFCNDEHLSQRQLRFYGKVFAMEPLSPASFGHYIIIPIRHTADLFGMTPEEHADTFHIINSLHSELITADKSITGFNVGMNCGESAGQTVFHAHTHLIPRRDGDNPNPRYGIAKAILV